MDIKELNYKGFNVSINKPDPKPINNNKNYIILVKELIINEMDIFNIIIKKDPIKLFKIIFN